MSNARRIADIFGGTAPTANTLQLGDSSQSRLFIPGVGIDTNTLSNNQTLQWNDTAGAFSNVSLGSSVTVYDSASLFPLTGNAAGDQAYASDTNRLFLFSGSGWYRIATINATPTLTTSPNASYDLDSNGGTATTISLTATDSDGTPIFWSYTADDSADDLATITNDSNGTFTITAKTLSDILAAGYDSSGGSFDVTFKASDNINFASATSEFTITFLSGVMSMSEYNGWAGNAGDPYALSGSQFNFDIATNKYNEDISTSNSLHMAALNSTDQVRDADGYVTVSGNSYTFYHAGYSTAETISQSTFNTGFAWQEDGSAFFITDYTSNEVSIDKYDLTTAWDTTTASGNWDESLHSLASDTSNIAWVDFSYDGTKMWTGDNSWVEYFELSTAWNPSTASRPSDYSNVTGDKLLFSAAESNWYTEGGILKKMLWNWNGKRLYMLFSTGVVRVYDFDDSPWTITGGNEAARTTFVKNRLLDASTFSFSNATSLTTTYDAATGRNFLWIANGSGTVQVTFTTP